MLHKEESQNSESMSIPNTAFNISYMILEVMEVMYFYFFVQDMRYQNMLLCLC